MGEETLSRGAIQTAPNPFSRLCLTRLCSRCASRCYCFLACAHPHLSLAAAGRQRRSIATPPPRPPFLLCSCNKCISVLQLWSAASEWEEPLRQLSPGGSSGTPRGGGGASDQRGGQRAVQAGKVWEDERPSTSRIHFTRLQVWQRNLHQGCLYPCFGAHFSDLWLIAY